MEKHNAPKVITVPIEPVLDSIQNIIFQLIRNGFKAYKVYEHLSFIDKDTPKPRPHNSIALLLLLENGFLDKNYVRFKTIKLITEAASELNISDFSCSLSFGCLEIEKNLVILAADKILQSCANPQG